MGEQAAFSDTGKEPPIDRRYVVSGRRVVLGNPYRSETVDETGELTLYFLAAAQPLLERRIGIYKRDPAFHLSVASDCTWRADLAGTRVLHARGIV